MLRLLLCISLLHSISVDSARILGFFPMPSVSHQVVFRALTMELAKRGHELVVVTTDPALPIDRPPDNITEIDVSFGYQRLFQMIMAGMKEKNIFKRGVIVTSDANLNMDVDKSMIPLFVEMVECPEFKKYTTDKSQHFDLILAESFMLNYHLIIRKIFKAPLILISSFHGFTESFDTIGAPTRHPILYPSTLGEIFNNASWIDRLKQIKFAIDSYRVDKKMANFENELLKKYYGPDAPTVEELKSNVDMLFINSHPVFCGNRPLPPNAVYVGPLHLQPIKELPKELKTYLDDSKTGVIYVSLGTNVRPSMMDKDLLDSFLNAFGELPYDIMWKFDGENLDNLSKNVRMQKWFPQRDLLVHPNIKLFVTQGGLQSTDEAIDAGVPLVGIPMLGDQYYNVHKYEELGIGVRVDALTLDKNTLLNGIKTVLNDDSYRKNIRKLKVLMNDNPQTPLERAVWWTEYVLRHGGAKHLQFPAATMPWSEYFMADIVVPIICLTVAVLILAYLTLQALVANIVIFRNPKRKQS